MASGSARRWTSKLASQISVAGGKTSSFVKQHGEIGDGRSQQCSNSDIGGCLLTFKLSFSWSNGLGLWWNLGSLFLSRYGLIGGDLQRSCETCLGVDDRGLYCCLGCRNDQSGWMFPAWLERSSQWCWIDSGWKKNRFWVVEILIDWIELLYQVDAGQVRLPT